ncbi:MAG TPA: hypothetical protein VGC21_12115 [Telluria sp.]|jgi:cyanophycin synthetase
MRLIEQRFLRGPNLWSSGSALHAVLDLGPLQQAMSCDTHGFSERLLACLPGLARRAAALHDGCLIAEVLGMVMLELQGQCASPPATGRVIVVLGHRGQATIIVPCTTAAAGAQACAAALAIVASLLTSKPAGVPRLAPPIRMPPLTVPVAPHLPALAQCAP